MFLAISYLNDFFSLWRQIFSGPFWPIFTPTAKKLHPFASVWCEIGVLWPNIKPVKSHTTAFSFWLQTGMNQIFQMRYCASLKVRRLQKYQRLKLEVHKKSAGSAGPWSIIQECTVPHLKDLIHICLEPEDQCCSMTLNRFYIGSKYPYFISYRGKWLYLFCHGCI